MTKLGVRKGNVSTILSLIVALAWNIGLMSGLDGDENDDVDEEPDDDDNDDDGDKSLALEKPKEKDHKYFKSPLFDKNIQEKVDKIKSAVNAQFI